MPGNQTERNPSGRERNEDPITGEPGAHPVGTGIGAASGGVTGAAIGSVGGPIGTAVGAVIGAVAGGLAGKGVAELIDPTAEDAYWREAHWSQPYAERTRPFEAYARAYRAGYTGYREGRSFEDREAELRMEYEGGPQQVKAEESQRENHPAIDPEKARSNLSTDPLRWEEARDAARAAYQRVQRGESRRAKPEIDED